MNKKKEKKIYFGLVERPCRFGLKKWEPLNLSWRRMICHAVIKAEPNSHWLQLFKNIVQSVLDQNGRVLIIDRNNTKLFDVEYKEKIIEENGHTYQSYQTISTEVDLAKISFNQITPHVIKGFSELNDLESFIWRKSNIKDPNKKILYIPNSISFQKSNDNEPIITSIIRNSLHKILNTPNDKVENSCQNEDEPVPVLFLTIGEPWYPDEPSLPSQLRALSISSFHLNLSMNDLSPIIMANSLTQLFIFNQDIKTLKGNSVDGFAHYREEKGFPTYESETINALFKIK